MESPRSLLEHRRAESVAFRLAANEAENAKAPPLSGPERRERTRVFSRLPLTVRFGGIYESVAEGINISARGMFFLMQQPLQIGSAVELVFRLPRRVIGVDGVWLRCPAEVVRVEGLLEGKFGIGAKINGYEVFLG
jgi:hypothetical protein